MHVSGQKTTNLQPGVSRGCIVVSGKGKVVLDPGIYYMDGGGFTFTGQGGMDAYGVLLVNAPQSNTDVLTINGNDSISFSPPTSGPYTGISLWQTRTATNTIYENGNSSSSISGIF
jgi:hypothetical protein